MTKDGRCSHPGCDEEIPPDRFACDTHWADLPEGIRYQAFGAWCSWRVDPGGGIAEAKVAQVQAQAVTWWRKSRSRSR